MTLMVCLDDKNGMLFNKRRQSRDAALISNAIRIAAPDKITTDLYSAQLFPAAAVQVADDPFSGTVCFAERGDFLTVKAKVERLVVYRWNRHYPADVHFPLEDYLECMTLQESMDFPGNSHEKITREVYVR